MFSLQNKIANINNIIVLQAIGRTDRQFQFVNLAQQVTAERQILAVVLGRLLLRLFEVDEGLKLFLKDCLLYTSDAADE